MPSSPDHVDIHVGKRLRQRRRALHLTQRHLAEALGLTFQQIQKYESGINKIAPGRLYKAARVLKVPVCWFFNGIEENPH